MRLPAVGPELAHWAHIDRLECSSATAEEAVDGLKVLKDAESFDTGLDTEHAIQRVVDIARELDSDQVVLLLASGPENCF
jgi:tryptophan synthase